MHQCLNPKTTADVLIIYTHCFREKTEKILEKSPEGLSEQLGKEEDAKIAAAAQEAADKEAAAAKEAAEKESAEKLAAKSKAAEEKKAADEKAAGEQSPSRRLYTPGICTH